jgi:predicted enzyme related to lactoylglutathione lyase
MRKCAAKSSERRLASSNGLLRGARAGAGPFLSVVGRNVRGMKLNMGGITIDSHDPRALAEFWTKALDLEVVLDADGFFLQLSSRTRPEQPYLGLQKVPEDRAGKNRVHIDFSTEDREGEVDRLVSLGATNVETHDVPGLTWTVLRDPEGNEFCVGSAHAR